MMVELTETEQGMIRAWRSILAEAGVDTDAPNQGAGYLLCVSMVRRNAADDGWDRCSGATMGGHTSDAMADTMVLGLCKAASRRLQRLVEVREAGELLEYMRQGDPERDLPEDEVYVPSVSLPTQSSEQVAKAAIDKVTRET